NEVDEAMFMSKITFKDIYIDGNKITEDTRKVIYLLPSQPLKYDRSSKSEMKEARIKKKYETTAFENPVIGTTVPAPPKLAILLYVPVPVNNAPINIIIIGTIFITFSS
ncbi:Acetyltransferase, partial [human gut metagenome]